MNNFIKISTFVFLCLVGIANAQNANVRGFLYEKSNSEPIIFTNVVLKGTTHGGQTDVNGYFSITKVPMGNYTILATALGFDTLLIPINVTKADEIITHKIYLPKRTIKLRELVVSADRQEQKTETKCLFVCLFCLYFLVFHFVLFFF